MKNMKKIFLFIVLIGLSTTLLTSCGRYATPSPVEDSGFPHNYPQH